jgi:peptide/nickel transport system ATP-binding protein
LTAARPRGTVTWSAPLVICDEPTSALDVSSQARLLDRLAKLQGRTGLCCLFTWHELAIVRQVSERIGVLHDGELVELKAVDAIFTEPGHWYTRSLVDSVLALRHLAEVVRPPGLRAVRRSGREAGGGR